MKAQNHQTQGSEQHERSAEQKTLRRLRKRKPKMKVSGAGVRKLQRIILKKAGKE